MKYKVSNIEDVKEEYRSLYEKKGDEYVLQVEGLPEPEDVSGLKSALQKERNNVADRDKQLQQWKKIGNSPDDVTSRIKKLEEARGDDTEHEKMIKQLQDQNETMKTNFANEKEKLEAQARTATENANNLIIETRMTAALAKKGFTKSGLEILPKLHGDRIRITERDGKQITEILTKDKSAPMVGKGKDLHATYDDLADEFANDYPELVGSQRKSGGGTPPNNATGNGADKTMSRDSFNALSVIEQQKVMGEGYQLTDSG